MSDFIAVTIWFFILEILGVVTFPLIFTISKNLHDRGYALSKIISILFVTYLTWISVSISQGIILYNIVTILTSLFFITLLSIYFFNKNILEIFAFFKKNKKLLLTYELIFLLAFLFFTVVRYYDNSILDAEKYQDFMILNGLLRTEKFPLNDPWFTGYPLQYYYFGYLMIATLTKISLIDSGITFNLALATLFSLTLLLSFSVIYNLTKKIKYGFFGLFLVGIVGNFRAIIQIFLEEKILPFDYWPSAHYIIPGTINEFPYWSFLHGDLHPHVIAIPFTIAVILLTLNFFLSKGKNFNLFGITAEEKILSFSIFSISLGALSFVNSWDFPTYLLLGIFSIATQQFLTLEKKRRKNFEFLKNSIFISSAIIAFSFIFFLPYYLSFSPARPIAIVKERTELQYFLIIYGLFIYILLSFLIFDIKYKFSFLGFSIKELFIFSIFFGVATLTFFFHSSFALIFLLLILIFLSLFSFILTLRNFENKEKIFSLILAIFAFSLALAIEFFFIDDAFTGSLERVNTVFKIGMQIWILMALSAAYALSYLKENFLKNLNFQKYIWLGIFAILLFSSLLFLPLATYTKVKNNFEFFGKIATLNGKEYLKQMKFCDFYAIEWLNKNVRGNPIILEAPGDSFRWESCVSANTGLPTLLGWEGHERQWRPSQLQEISKRKQDVNKIYSYRSYSKTGKISIPDSWQELKWEGDALLTRNEEGISQGKMTAIKISSVVGANANFWQKIYLEGGNSYILEAWIKTNNIAKVGDVEKVAQIHVREDLNNAPGNIISESVPMLGTNYWTKVEIPFFLPEQENSVWISCVLANWGKAKGEIFFDEISIYKVKENEKGEEINMTEILTLIKKYNISYIYAGNLEREKYYLENFDKFLEFSDLVYNTIETKIYKVKNGI
ncbi:MAG: DUF2298 domain-containing protein [Candidatus Altiarchaeota archaeon]